MITVPKDDYKALLKQLYLIAVYDYTPELWVEVEKELRTDITWEEAMGIVDELQKLGRRSLQEGLYLHLVEAKKVTIYRRDRKADPEITPQDYNWIGTMADDIWKITEEIKRWYKTVPPLTWRNEPVVHVESNVSPIDVESWDKAGRPKTWCILHDQFLIGYLNAMKADKCKEYCEAFLKTIKEDRERQMIARMR
jgi:hypothetical protein